MPHTERENTLDSARRFRDDLVQAGRNVWFAGLGAVAMAEDEARGTFHRLVNRGRELDKDKESRIGRTVEDLSGRAKNFTRKVETQFQDTMHATLRRVGVPNRDEIQTLIRRVEELTHKVDQLKTKG
jgi:poly(hydroxyalkanoate) granule-associated protein